MKKIDDESFKKIFELRKFKDLIDWSTVEVRMAFLTAIIMTVLSCSIIYFNGTSEYIALASQLIKDVGVALIGFLGFIVTGLAILTGSISSKVINFFKNKKVYDEMESILLSFYFLGLITGIIIFLILGLYVFSQIKIRGSIVVSILATLIISYGIVYIIFYSIGLIGNCISIFEIISDVESRLDQEENNYKKMYDSYRIIALEFLILTGSNDDRVYTYEEKMRELILKDMKTSDIQKKKLLEMKETHFAQKGKE